MSKEYAAFGTSNAPSVKKNVFEINSFRGVDLFNAPANVADGRSPEAPNMVRDVPGKVRKRMGYHKTGEFADPIYGVHFLNSEKVIHSGKKLYYNGSEVYSDMAERISKAWQIQGKLYIQDGKKLLIFGKLTEGSEEYSVATAQSKAYIPTILIGRSPTGGGKVYESINLLGAGRTESFLGTEGTKEYQLSAKDLDQTEVKAEKLNSSGEFDQMTEGTDFTVNRTEGTVTFNTAPGISPASGADNVKITYYKTVDGAADKINKCCVSVLYGVDGTADRLFVTGNEEFKNYDWYSQKDDPTYFGDDFYSVLGQDKSGIVGYSIVNNYLAAHKSESEDGRNVILRYGTLDTSNNNEAVFKIYNNIQGAGAIGKYNFAYLNEPLFVTKLGVYAITAADITGEKYTQHRSFYINSALMQEDLENSFAFVYNDYYILATANRMYLLDGLQKTYEKNTPYSSFQYECYYFEIPGVKCMWKENDTLCFGTGGGKTYAFYTNPESPESYNDDGEAISARWDLPDFDGRNFFKNKTFRYISVRLAAAIATGMEVWALRRGLWTRLFDSGARARYFDFSYVDFGKINFSSDETPRTIGSKIKVKKVDKARFSIRNNVKNEPFGVYNVALEYTEGGNFKG